MAGVKRELTGHTITALVCAGIWIFGLLWMWLDFHYGSHVWTITPGPILMMLAMMVAVPALLYCCLVFARCKRQGLPVFTKAVSPATATPPVD
jgi:hypothetical protein